MQLLTCALLSLVLVQEKAETKVTCKCGAWMEAKDGVLSVGLKKTTIASTPIYRGHVKLLGKDVDLTKSNKLTCPCKKKVIVPAWFTLPVGTHKCSGCKGDWIIDATRIKAKAPNGQIVVNWPIENGIVRPEKSWAPTMGEEIDLFSVTQITCICRSRCSLRTTAPPKAGGMPPKKKVKSGKKYGVVKCDCGSTLTVFQNYVTVAVLKKKLFKVPVTDGKATLLGKEVDFKEESALTCPCGKEVTVPALAAGKR